MLPQIPLLRSLIPFIIGIIGGYYFTINLPWFVLPLVCIALISLSGVNLFKKYRYEIPKSILIYGLFFILGFWTISIQKKHSKSTLSEQRYLLLAEVSEIPKQLDKNVKITAQLRAVKIKNEWQNNDGKIIIYLPKDSNSISLKIGDVIGLNPNVNIPKKPKNPHQFNYKEYLMFNLINYQAFVKSNEWVKLSDTKSFSLYHWAQQIRTELLQIIDKMNFNANEKVIAQALILGFKDEMNDNVKNAYTAAGATHVLAVSGLHVGILYLIIQWLFGLLKSKKQVLNIVQVLITLACIWFYALITGLSVSVVRAATMFSFISFGKLFNRNAHILNSLAASAFLLLIINPYNVFQLGFQLSYLAVAGIVLLQPIIADWWQPQLKALIWVRDLFSVSLAAQISTLPLTLLYFHQFPTYFLLTNLLVIPAAFVILLLGIVSLLMYFIHPLLFEWSAQLLHWAITFTNTGIFSIQNFNYSVIENIPFRLHDTLLFYTMLIAFLLALAWHKTKLLLVGLGCFLCLIVSNIWFHHTVEKHKLFYVYDIPHYSAINFIDGTDNILIVDKQFYARPKNVNFTLKNNWIAQGVASEKVVTIDKLNQKHSLSNIYKISNLNVYVNNRFFWFYGKRILLIDKNFNLLSDSIKIPIDLLIVSKNAKIAVEEIRSVFSPDLVILDSSNSPYYREKFKKESSNFNLSIYDVSENGAFCLNY